MEEYINSSSEEEFIDEENEYFIQNYNEYNTTDEDDEEDEDNNEKEIEDEDEDEISINSSETKSKTEKNIFDELNSDENETILILSSNKIIKENKIIYNKKIMINAITNHFTNNENLLINSIFNYNSNLLLSRNKLLNEYVLIMIILNIFNIEILNNTIKIFPEIPWSKKNKKYKKIYNEIIEQYDFKKFTENNKCKIKYNNKNNIKPLINGFVFYIKNIILLNKELFKDENEKLNELKKIILKNENAVFCKDENLNIISSWLHNLVKRILLFYFSKFLTENKYNVFFKKTLEDQVYIILNIVFYLIIILQDENKLKKKNIEKNKLKTFLIFNFQNTFIKDIIENDIFSKIIVYIYKNKNKKVFLCKKKNIDFLLKNLL